MIKTRLYIVDADNHDYDEYDSVIVRARNKAAALKLAKERIKDNQFHKRALKKDKYSMVKHVREQGKEEIIIASFNAG